MNAVGIVAEYNPFHKGHEYHINRTKELLGSDLPVVAVMSGDLYSGGNVPYSINLPGQKRQFSQARTSLLNSRHLTLSPQRKTMRFAQSHS